MSGGITYDGHISKPGNTELKVGSSEKLVFTGALIVSHCCA